MSSSDASEIKRALNLESYPDQQKYSRVVWNSLPDTNNNSYSQKLVNFDTLELTNKNVNFGDSYLKLPLDVRCITGGTAYTATTNWAFKASVLALITGLMVKINGGNAVQKPNHAIHILNNLKLMRDRSYEWAKTRGHEIFFSRDTQDSRLMDRDVGTGSLTDGGKLTFTSDPAGDVTVAALPAAAGVLSLTSGGGLLKDRSVSNAGFAERVKWCTNADGTDITFTAGTTHNFTVNAYIPLKLIDDFFYQMDFPIKNARLQLSFGIDWTTYPPIVVGKGFSNAAVSIQANQKCELWYKEIFYEGEEGMKVLQSYEKGFSRTIDYETHDLYIDNATALVSGSTTISKLVTPSVFNPKKLLVCMYPSGALYLQSDQAIDAVATSASTSYSMSPLVSTGKLTDVNVLLNNSQYFEQNLITPFELFRELKQQFPSLDDEQALSSQICLTDFLNIHRYHWLDLTRDNGRIRSGNVPVSLTFKAKSASTATYDIYYFIERLTRCVLNFSQGTISVSTNDI